MDIGTEELSHLEVVGTLALQIGEKDVATLLSHSLGEEETTDFLLTELSKPLLQDALLEDMDSALPNVPGKTAGKKPVTSGRGK